MALGMSAFPSFMTQATPATQPLINAEPAVTAQAEQNPQVGQVMPGVQGADAPVVAQNGPSRDVKLTFAQIAPPPGSMVLRGINPNGSIEFGMRSDEVVTKAMLNLEYTPSPSLLPVQSQLKVYLNDELMGVLPVTKEQLGKKTLAQMPINPLFITDFNRVRLEFVGHYQDVCENPASTTLWLDVGRSSGLDLTYQTLNVKNDLSHFPVPFFDPRDNRTNTLPMVFAGAPDVELQQASAIVASWFGSRSGWRGQNFPVLYNQLPDRNAIVFATNDKRPDFLRDHPAVKAPVIEMINHPQNPYVKLLVVFGRDDKDLLQAAKGIAQGNILFRGESVVVNEVKPLLPRKPYDAPNWVRTDRPVTFGELKTYEEQLQSSGLEPAAINVSLNLPPDLYLMRSTGRVEFYSKKETAMQYHRIPHSSLEVSTLGLGTMTFGEQNSEADAHAQLDYAVAQGINLIDVAEMYPVPPRPETQGLTETYVGNWLAKHGSREKLIIASKVSGPSRNNDKGIRPDQALDRKNIREALHDSLKRLQTDYLDLYQVHWPQRPTNCFGKLGYSWTDSAPAVSLLDTLDALAEYQRAGKIRYIGVSNETAFGVMRYLHLADKHDLPRIVTIQTPYSLLNRSFEVGLAEVSQYEGVELLAYSCLGSRILL